MNTNTDHKLDVILNAIRSLEARVTRIESGSAGTSAETKAHSIAKKLSIKEFLLENPPPTDIQRTLAIGYFLETHVGIGSFTKTELEKGYSDAKEPMPANISMNINRCIKQGHLMEAEEKKNNKTSYVVTRRGEEFVQSGYKNSAAKIR